MSLNEQYMDTLSSSERASLNQLVAADRRKKSEDDEDPSSGWGKNTALNKAQAKYLLRRLQKDDPTLKKFFFSFFDTFSTDDTVRAILSALKTNTHCKHFVFSGCGFSNKNVIDLFKALKKRPVDFLDVSENCTTQHIVPALLAVLQSSETKWKAVQLGRVQITPSYRELISKYKQIRIPETNAKRVSERKKYGLPTTVHQSRQHIHS